MVKRQEDQSFLEYRVLDFIRGHHLVSGRQRLVVAVSGGQDSVCLLHILVKLQVALKVKLHVAHLNHQLRGAESDADAQYVYHLAGQLGIPVTIEQRDVKDYQSQQRTSLEEAAREARYAFLAQVAESAGTDRVAVGHTTDDHVETILMHLIRGTGARGLRGLQPDSRWQPSGSNLAIIRPLLRVSRQETADYCCDGQLIPRVDSSNLSLSPLRNRIRQQLVPLLQSYNPRVSEALLRTARMADDDLALLDETSVRLWGRIVQTQEETIIFDKEGLLELPSALQRHLLRMAIEKLLGSLKDIETRHIEGIRAALTNSAGKRINLPRGLVFAIEYGQFRLGPDPVALSPFPVLSDEFALKIPGDTLLPGWRIAATVFERGQIPGTGKDFTAYLDLDKAGDRMVVRSCQPGDRFQPLGMNQSKKLGEFMIDAKISRPWRQSIPIVCSPQHILWVVGWRIDDRVKVTKDTGEVLCLEFERTSDNCG